MQHCNSVHIHYYCLTSIRILSFAAGIPNDFALAGVAIGTSNNIQIRLSVTFAPGEAEKIIEAIKLVDDQWSEPVKAIRVEFDHFSDPVKIMGYDETIISLLDDDGEHFTTYKKCVYIAYLLMSSINVYLFMYT